MKCSSCGAQWSPPPNSIIPKDRCPFCGASLAPAGPAKTLADALQKIVAALGQDILHRNKELLAAFSDFAPELKKERLLLEYLLRNDTHLRLMEAVDAPPAQQRTLYSRAVHTLNQEQYIVREAAEQVCSGFLEALGVTIKPEAAPRKPADPTRTNLYASLASVLKGAAAAQKQTTGAGKIPSAANTSYDPKSPINCYEDYKKALTTFFVQNGRRKPTNAQILGFIWTYKLDTRFGITPEDVKQDLHAIAPSIC